ncbi:MAG TPA: DegV family protein [Dermatophilaceae bacterium]|jgi:DegV family protein with EDD domain|nr:DegV family protein [Dermatophilaceae bacterium]
MAVAIVTDSTAYLAPARVAQLRAQSPVGFDVVPLHVVVGGKEHREGIDVSALDLGEALRRFVPVTTSRPAPAEFLEAYERLAAAGADSIVSVHISADMSATVQGAHLAAAQSPVPVTVVDSRVIGMALGYAAVSAAEAAAAGADAAMCARVATRRAQGASVVFYVHTLEHLRRGGRIGSASALLGSALAIKPILSLRDGHIEPIEKVRTSGRALARMVELAGVAADAAREAGQIVDVSVQHVDFGDKASEVATALADRISDAGEIVIGALGAVVGAHVGPGTVAITVSPRVALA